MGIRLLLLSRTSDPLSALKQELDSIEQTLGLTYPDIETKLIGVREWYQEHIQRCGDLTSWYWDTVLGKDVVTRTYHFDGFLISPPINGSSYEIARLAEAKKRPLLILSNGLLKATTLEF